MIAVYNLIQSDSLGIGTVTYRLTWQSMSTYGSSSLDECRHNVSLTRHKKQVPLLTCRRPNRMSVFFSTKSPRVGNELGCKTSQTMDMLP